MTYEPRIIVNLTPTEEHRWRVLELAGFRFEWGLRTDWHGNDHPSPPFLCITAPNHPSRLTRFIAEEQNPKLALALAWEWWWSRVWRAHLTRPSAILGSELVIPRGPQPALEGS